MKAFKAIGVLVAVAASWHAHAAAWEGWERPVSKARMDVVSAQADMAQVKNVELVMTQQDGYGSPTGFVLLIDDQAIHFSVTRKAQGQCGIALYTARSMAEVGVRSYQLEVADHTQRNCVPRPGGRFRALPVDQSWQASLRDRNASLLELVGYPEPVVSIQN